MSILIRNVADWSSAKEILWAIVYIFLEVIKLKPEREVSFTASIKHILKYKGLILRSVDSTHHNITETIVSDVDQISSKRAALQQTPGVPPTFKIAISQLDGGAQCTTRGVAEAIGAVLAQDLAGKDVNEFVRELVFDNGRIKIELTDSTSRDPEARPRIPRRCLTWSLQLIAEHYFLKGYSKTSHGLIMDGGQVVGYIWFECKV